MVLISIATRRDELQLAWHYGTKEGKKHLLGIIKIIVTSRFSALRRDSSICSPTLQMVLLREEKTASV